VFCVFWNSEVLYCAKRWIDREVSKGRVTTIFEDVVSYWTDLQDFSPVKMDGLRSFKTPRSLKSIT